MTTLVEEPMVAEDLQREGRIESLLNEWSLPFEFVPEYPLKKVDASYEDAQVRQMLHRAPAESAEEFTTQMRGQIQQGRILFPPLVLTHNGRLVDGNTRVVAAERNGLEAFPAYLVKLDRPDQGMVLGAALNQMGGRRLTAEEAFAAAEKMMRDGAADEAIARTIGKSVESVRNYRREQRFRESAERTGVKDLPVTRSVQRVVADVKHDEPFRAAVKLAAETKASKKDVQDLVRDVASARSEREELEVISRHRKKLKPSGPPPPKKASHTAAKQAGRRLDALLAVTAPPSELAPAALRADLEPKWLRARDLADQVLAAFAETPEPEGAPAA
jgi:ParB-like chromosome segregation protein Spo0J